MQEIAVQPSDFRTRDMEKEFAPSVQKIYILYRHFTPLKKHLAAFTKFSVNVGGEGYYPLEAENSCLSISGASTFFFVCSYSSIAFLMIMQLFRFPFSPRYLSQSQVDILRLSLTGPGITCLLPQLPNHASDAPLQFSMPIPGHTRQQQAKPAESGHTGKNKPRPDEG